MELDKKCILLRIVQKLGDAIYFGSVMGEKMIISIDSIYERSDYFNNI